MNDIENAKVYLELCKDNLERANLALEKAQKPKIQIEHLGVYELENGEVVYARASGSIWWLSGFGTRDNDGRTYDSDGISNHLSPVVKHVGKIAIVKPHYSFHPDFSADPLTFNKAEATT